MSNTDPGLVIIGTGLAGYAVAREFRKWNKEFNLTLISADDGAFYSKPQLSATLGSKKSLESLVLKTASAMASELNATVLTHTRVRSVDKTEKELVLESGNGIKYTSLVLAVGANARKADIKLEDGAPIFSVNSLDDYRLFYDALQTRRTVAILGTGLIGCEFANDLALSRLEVTLIGNGIWPLQGLLPSGMGEALRVALERVGINWKLNSSIESIHRTGLESLAFSESKTPAENTWSALLQNGSAIKADIFLSAIGFDPNLDLAKKMELKTNRAISVDANLQTSEKDVYAIGDCAEIMGIWRPYVMPLNLAARALGQTLAGKPMEVQFPPMPVVVKTPSYPLCILPPPTGLAGIWEENIDEAGAEARFTTKDGRVYGFALGGNRVASRAELLQLIVLN